MMVSARYEGGVFRPLDQIAIDEGTIVEVLVPASPVSASALLATSICDSPIFGLWKDRDDIGDSAEYVERLRRTPRG